MVSIDYDKKSTLQDIVPSQTVKNIKLLDMFPIYFFLFKEGRAMVKALT